ncbi:MAG: polyprenyl synthetase family protein [Actinomycetota bacterium]|nr:polyprenyl synthetase family protein [Rubrobacteraceae bacterium]MDQ3182026.1 polyprenyl synthetase family protein [Actinomycetota bacterium]
MERVFAFLDELILALPVRAGHRELLRIHLRVGKEQAEAWPQMSSTQLPLLVHAAITGDERPALPVAGACTLLYIGADLFDSILDHELPPLWHVRDKSEASLAATTLLGALPQLSIARLQAKGTPLARLWALAHLFADAGLTMGAGQYEDLLLPALENVSVEECRAMAEKKSGAEYALFAAAGATLATEDPSTIEAYAAFGSCFGIAQQLINDAQDIWGDECGQDLLNGKRTFPVVHALSTLTGEQRERLQTLLAAARASTEHHDGVRALLAAAGSLRYTALIVWLYQQQARSHLASASPREPAGSELYTLLDQASILP